MATAGPSATPTEFDPNEMSASVAGEATPAPEPSCFPPYPPYAVEPAPPSVADTIIAGRDMRVQHKSTPKKPVRPAPKPAKPRGPKATDVKMSKRASRAHARCLRRHNAVLTDRLERMSKPPRRNIICLWRENADTLPADTIGRLRSMLDADEPFKPDQAYEYFVNLKKTKKKTATMRVNQIKKDVLAMCGDKRFVWARNATVAFARGIQQRLSRPGRYALADGMLRLSNIIMDDICGHMHMKTPSRRCPHPKAKFMMEMSDKVAVWIDEILCESDDRMLMMDFDEDDEVEQSYADVARPEMPPESAAPSPSAQSVTDGENTETIATPGETPGASPAGSPDASGAATPVAATAQATPAGTPTASKADLPANTSVARSTTAGTYSVMRYDCTYYERLQPPLSRYNEGQESNIKSAGVSMLKENSSTHQLDVLNADEAGDAGFADDFLNMMGGGGLLKGPQPAYLKFTGEMLEAFLILTSAMNKKGDQQLLQNGKFSQTYTEGADELKSTPDFEATEFNTVLAAQLNKDLTETAKSDTPKNIAPFMKDMVDICANYLAQNAEFNKDKGPAFRLLVKTMKVKPNQQLYVKEKAKRTFGKAATELEESKGLESDHDDPNLSQEIHGVLSKLMESETPSDFKADMTETLDICSKYLSQRAIDEIERGPAFDILIKELERDGSDDFTPNYPPIGTKFAAAYTLKSAPGLGSVDPDPATAPLFIPILHRAVDAATPKALVNDMNEVIGRCANYLSAFVRDRDKALQCLLKIMKTNASRELAKRNNYSMNYGTGAVETESAPIITPFLPVKDIADEAKVKLTADVEASTPPELKIAMKSMVQDVSKHLSQPIALRSGAAGERYPLNFLSAIKNSLGTRPLFKYKSYGQTYADAAEVLKYAGPLEYDPKAEDLQLQISSEMNRGVSSRLPPTITAGLSDIMTDAAKHLAKAGMEKGKALEYLVNLMKEQGDSNLGQMQGYQQTYNDGARRIENTPSLANDKVDKGTYEAVRGKLAALVTNKPSSEHEQHLPGVIDESSKFLAAPLPESAAEKRRVLADLMARKGDEILGQEGLYKLTYTEAGEEIIKAPVGVTTAHDEAMKKVNFDKVNTVMPDKKMQDLLKDPADEGAAYITDLIKGRGEAMQVIHDGMKKEGSKDFLTIGKFQKTHEQAAGMLGSASHFGGQNPAPLMLEKVTGRLDSISKVGGSDLAKEHMSETSVITATYIAGVATNECGLDAKALAAMDGSLKAGGAGGSASLSSTGSPISLGKGGLGGAGSGTGTGAGMGAGAGAAAGAGSGGRAGAGADDADAERRRKEEEARRKKKEEEKRRSAAAEVRRAHSGGAGGVGEFDPEREAAISILHKQLRSKGSEVLYKQPQTELTHTQASTWLGMKPPLSVDKTVKESADTARLSTKFERKLSALVSKCTPHDMYDTMQDVIIESSRILAEAFVSSNYKALVKDALISEMQKRGNEILIEVNGAAESYFFSAQRLKKAKSLEVKEPCTQVSYYLSKNLDEMIRCRSMARKLTATMKEHIKDAADYLSELVTKPDEQIEAYVALLGEMEATGDTLLIEGDIPKSYKDSAAYLRQLTSFEDQIKRGNSSLQSSTEAKLKSIMANVPPRGYTKSHLDAVISESTRLLVSYIMLQGEKTEALKILIERLEEAGQAVLLRHGTMRKSYVEGADMLKGKNADQLSVFSVDPVVSRKIQIKLLNLMHGRTPDKYQALMDDVIEDATMYLAVHFLQPRVIQVCKCMKNVFVQCELWCDEILRRVARPCCTCSRHVSAQALADLAPAQKLRISPGSSRAFAPGIEISLTQCPSRQSRCNRKGSVPIPCPAAKPTSGCVSQSATTQYLLYSTSYNQRYTSPTRLEATPSDSLQTPVTPSPSPVKTSIGSPIGSLLFDLHGENFQRLHGREDSEIMRSDTSSPCSFHTPASTPGASEAKSVPYWQSPTTMFAKMHTQDINVQTRRTREEKSRRASPTKSGYSSTRTPIVSTDQMSDWHAMMVSLMWNVQAWRDWIQENIDRALSYQRDPDISTAEAEEKWTGFQRRVATEALQWRQYNIFSRQLTLRLALRYRDKHIVSPTRATDKTESYMECQQEMLEIIEMFNRWTQWLTAVVKETNSLTPDAGATEPMHELQWNHFKVKVLEYSEDWMKYNMHLKVCWEHKYRTLIADWLPAWKQPGPVWVVSACGAVPSGAVSAGIFDNELVWVARTTHRCNVLPAALHPSKHCCIVYADGGVHHYTKYQVMCNAEAKWLAWRAGAVGARAVRVAPGTHVGRVHYRGSHLVGAVHAPHYRCHVVIFGRPFAFNCYELLVLGEE